MRSALTRLLLAVIVFFFLSGHVVSAQNCFNTGLNGTVINLPCNQNCVNIPVRIPHLKSSADYIVNSVAYTPYAYVTAGGLEDIDIYDDDMYSNFFDLPFNFCFYDSVYNKVVVGSNGLITFDETNGTGVCENAYTTTLPIPTSGTAAQCARTGTYYPRAAIFGLYTDLDPTDTESPSDRKIEWRVEGSAPCRRFVVSYYNVGTFGQQACGLATPTTFQMVIYESTGIVEVFIENYLCHAGTSSNKAVVGMQNWARNAAVWAPGKNSTVFTSANEGYRFTPSGGASRFVKCEVFNIGGTTPLALGDTTTTTAGILDVTFPSFCPVGSGNQYVVKTTFTACDNIANEIVSYDTITINKTNSLNATGVVTPTSCGVAGSGTATITVPTGIGTAPYTFVLNPGSVTLTGNSPQAFSGLVAGAYTVTVTDASAGCVSIVPVNIVSTGTLSVTYSITNTTCVGPSNGSIAVDPPNGTLPITYSINGGPFTTNNVFSGLAPGTYFISTHDNAGCVADLIPVTVNAGPSITLGYTTTPTSCLGASNGTVNITPAPPVPGTAPYQYAINGGPYQSSSLFSGLQATTYFFDVRDAVGCTITFYPITIPQGTGTVTGTPTATPTACIGVNNGSINVTPVGTGPFQYSLNGGPYQASSTFSGLAPGNYTVTIREAGLCISAPLPVTVTAGSALLATVTSENTKCNGAADGTITIQPTNGTAPYTFTLDGTVIQTGPSTIFNGVAAGLHTVVVRDAAGCQSAAIPVTITAGPVLTGSATFIPATCPGVNNGTITAIPANNLSAPYTYALDGGAPQSSSLFTGVAAGLHNVVIRSVSGCTSANIPVTVTAGSGITATLTSSPTACTGVSTGTIEVTNTNGTAPYTFVLDGTVTLTGAVANFTLLAAGTHTVTITDAMGCTTTAPLTTNITTGGGFTATYTSVNSSCTGATNGSITVRPSAGGTSPYTFVLGTTTLTGATDATFGGLAAGTYSVLITDANGCQFTLGNATVTANAGFTATYTSVNSSCTGATNGSITVTPGLGSISPYTFVLGTTTLTGATDATFGGLASGTYSVLVTDASGCQFALNNATVTASAGFTATYSAANTTCTGAADGSITVTPGATGTGPYTFVLGTTTLTGATDATFGGLASGTYSVLVTDANGCQFTLNGATVTAGPPLNVPVVLTNTTCPGVNDGKVVATPSNGNGPYTFLLDATISQTGATNTTFNGLAAGPHTMVVTDANGCSITLPSFTIGSGTGIAGSISLQGTSCIGAVNGSISITPTNGTGPYTGILNGTTTQTGATIISFSSLAAGGAYSIVVTDAIGCTGTFSNINIPQGSALMVNTATVPTTCSQASNGELIVTPPNGAGPYTFVLNGTVTQTGATNTTFINLPANTYSVVVTDAAGCVSSPISATIPPGAPITVAPAKIDATCFSTPTGTISAVASPNATAPVEFSLNNNTWQTSPFFNGLASNTYTVYIRDAAGCTNSANINVGQPLQLVASTAVKNVLCNNQDNGVIKVTGTGGTPGYTYSLDNITYQAGDTFIVAAGSYDVYVKDAKGCVSQPITVNVTEPNTLTATAIAANATCDGGNDGTITVTPAGGVAPYQYAITGSSFQAANALNVGPNTYDVIVRDANGCSYPINGVVVGLTNNLTLTPAIDPAPICEGSSAQLQLTTNATEFTWTQAASLSSSTIINPMARPSVPTTYSVTATLGRCSLTDDIFVDVMQAPVPEAGPGDKICTGQSYTLQPTGDPSYTYTWAPSTYLSSGTGYSVTSYPDKTITYTLSVTDNNGCTSLVTDQVTVVVTPPILVTIFPADTVVFAGQKVPLLAVSEGIYYDWSPATGLDNPNSPNPVATASMIDGDVVTYQVTATTDAGCKGEGYVTITVYKGPDIYTPNAFTPNGDGRNETFIPFPVGIKQLNYFRVFNRWGQLLFSTTTLNKGWDAKFAGVEQPTGVYVWMVEGVTMDNKKITKKGTVTIIR